MIKLKNMDATLTVLWYALPKFSLDVTKALAKGTLGPQARTTYTAPTSVNILFAFQENQYAALCVAGKDSTVVFYNPPPIGAWCMVS